MTPATCDTLKLFFSFFFQVIISEHTNPWVKINVSQISFNLLKIHENGVRWLHCGNIDAHFNGKFHWRFNGSSILPKKIEVARNKLILPNGSQKNSASYAGVYECCVRESLGNACYATTVIYKPPNRVFSVNNGDEIKIDGKESLLLRLGSQNRDNFSCTIDGESKTELIFTSSPQKGRHQLQIRIDEMKEDLFGKYKCFINHKGKQNQFTSFLKLSEKY
ncbi:unnamed protein product, partial [Mesorhabditis belari]|uniref:Ig-like domain-containing protein n=1 Tax=Mesorhabditis belari TaxID=2138241 RepID=A0AAF3FKV2_9BILA